MAITAKYTATGSIELIEDGVLIGVVPDDMSNRHRQRIAEWEAQGNTIAPYGAPPSTPDETRRANFKADAERIAMIDQLRNSTPAQIEAYIDTNLTNLAQMRAFLKRLTKVLAIVVSE